ncbi:MAG: hypothetical protein J0I31_13720 [Rhizobiales bacterium]|nr:hypothetical protein [Hyphomicrobiales bacterium]
MTPDLATLRRLVDLVDAELAALPAIDTADLDTFRKRRGAVEAAARRLALEGARSAGDGSLHRFALAGIRSSSTMGLDGAMQNWAVAARKKHPSLEAGGAE